MSELPSLRVMCRRVLFLQTLGSDTFRVTLRQRVPSTKGMQKRIDFAKMVLTSQDQR
jgi:hypothetical protein